MVSIAWARRREWAARNPEKYRAQKRAWYEKNKDQISKRNKETSAERVAANRRYYEKHPEKLRLRWIKSKYRVTAEEYQRKLQEQGGVCAICLGPESDRPRGWFNVDHDHETGKFRGLLCGLCNRMLGQAKDDPQRLLAGADYLLKVGGDNPKY